MKYSKKKRVQEKLEDEEWTYPDEPDKIENIEDEDEGMQEEEFEHVTKEDLKKYCGDKEHTYAKFKSSNLD